MSTETIAHAFTKLCAQGKLDEAQRYWSDEVASVEAFPGPHQIVKGRDAVLQKQRGWYATTTVHGVTCDGPFVNGDQFSVIFKLDCTMQGNERQVLHEIALYTVKAEAIVEERFFPHIG